MNRILGTAIAVVAGVALAVAALIGMAAARDDDPGTSQTLDVDGWCRHEYGEQATAFHPGEPDVWRCSAWRNGVWGLDDVDLDAACDWQRGQDATEEPPAADAVDDAPSCRA